MAPPRSPQEVMAMLQGVQADEDLMYGTIWTRERIGIGDISSYGEREAAQIAGDGPDQELIFQYECVRRVIRKRDGASFGRQAGHEFDVWWEHIGMKGRRALLQLHLKRNGFAKSEIDDFFDGVTTDTDPVSAKEKRAKEQPKPSTENQPIEHASSDQKSPE